MKLKKTKKEISRLSLNSTTHNFVHSYFLYSENFVFRIFSHWSYVLPLMDPEKGDESNMRLCSVTTGFHITCGEKKSTKDLQVKN